MTPIERIKRKIELKFQYIVLLGDKIDETRREIRVLQDELAELEKKRIKKIYIDPPIPEIKPWLTD